MVGALSNMSTHCGTLGLSFDMAGQAWLSNVLGHMSPVCVYNIQANETVVGKGMTEKLAMSGACVGEPPPDQLRGDIGAGPWQRTGAVGEGGPAHLDNTLRGALRSRRRTRSLWLLDCYDGGGREGGAILTTFDLQSHVSSVVHGYK